MCILTIYGHSSLIELDINGDVVQGKVGLTPSLITLSGKIPVSDISMLSKWEYILYTGICMCFISFLFKIMIGACLILMCYAYMHCMC